jgi:hypothetical protein
MIAVTSGMRPTRTVEDSMSTWDVFPALAPPGVLPYGAEKHVE